VPAVNVRMLSRLRLLLLGLLLLPHRSAVSQVRGDGLAFDCGAVTATAFGKLQYEDFGYGFRFDLPFHLLAGQSIIHDPQWTQRFVVQALFAADPKTYLAGAATGPTETIRGLKWTELRWPDGRVGSFTYHDGVMVTFVGSAVGVDSKTEAPAELLAALKQIQSSFAFFDDPYRIDHQLAALKVGQKLGDLTIAEIVSGTAGSDHPTTTIKFAGQLTVSGQVISPYAVTPIKWRPYFATDFNAASRAALPQLNCPVEGASTATGWTPAIEFTNQKFTNQQFANVPFMAGQSPWYQNAATVIVDDVTAVFGDGAAQPAISANLVKVVSKDEQHRSSTNLARMSADYWLGQKGDLDAMSELAYFYGNRPDPNYDEALRWYFKAAEGGNAGARSAIGDMYFEGHGVQKDYAEAARWYGCPKPDLKIFSSCAEWTSVTLPPEARQLVRKDNWCNVNDEFGMAINLSEDGSPVYTVSCHEFPHGEDAEILIGKIAGVWKELGSGYRGAGDCHEFVPLARVHNGFHDVCLWNQCAPKTGVGFEKSCTPDIWKFSNGRYRSADQSGSFSSK
jgi:Sel1 repeat